MSKNALAAEEGLQKLSDAAYAFIGHRGGPNHGFLITDGGLVVVDNDIRDVDRFLAAMRSITPRTTKYLINTHHAFDHTSANQIFAEAGATIISSSRCREYFAEVGQAKMEEKRAEEEKTRELTEGIEVILPTVTFHDRLALHLGSHRVELIFVGHCHSPGDAIVFVPEEKMVFVGDLLQHGYHLNLREGNMDNWIRALDRIYEMPVDTIVAGHGPVIRGKEECRIVKEYFLAVRGMVEDRAKAGGKLEDIRQACSLSLYPDWGKTKWLSATIEIIYREYVSRQHP